MPNFQPFRQYLFFCLDRLEIEFGLGGPFLDVGCGTGELCLHLAGRGWSGKGIDISDAAVAKASQVLSGFEHVRVEAKSLFDEFDLYETVFICDVLEHLPADREALERLFSIVKPGGHLVIGVPSNPREWRWDDDFYGHYRRYTQEQLQAAITQVGFSPILFWDFTFPAFWAMRRLYTALKSPPAMREQEREGRTAISSMSNAFDIPVLSAMLQNSAALWRPFYYLQFTFFRAQLERGHAMLALVRKPLPRGHV